MMKKAGLLGILMLGVIALLGCKTTEIVITDSPILPEGLQRSETENIWYQGDLDPSVFAEWEMIQFLVRGKGAYEYYYRAPEDMEHIIGVSMINSVLGSVYGVLYDDCTVRLYSAAPVSEQIWYLQMDADQETQEKWIADFEQYADLKCEKPWWEGGEEA